MPTTEEPTWEINGEAEEMVSKIVELNPEKFGHVDPEQIGAAMIVGKDPPDSQDWDAKLAGIKQPELIFSKKTYVIKFFKATWEKYDKKQRSAMLFKMLSRIPEDFDGTVLKEDLHDCRILVRKFGLDYMASPSLPDLTEQKIAIETDQKDPE